MTIRVLVLKASNWNYKRVKEFNSAEELMKFINKQDKWIVYTKKGLIGAVLSARNNVDLVLKIYDDYVE